MDVNTKLKVWKSVVMGMSLDIDRAFGAQCADVPLSWGQALFPGIHYSIIFPPVKSAKDMFDTANTNYFDKIPNNHGDVNQLPQPGDIAIFAGSPEAGYQSTYNNPDGHAGVVDHADTNFVWLVQQDGSMAQVITQLKQRPWRQTRCIGWLRPKLAVPNEAVVSGPTTDPRIGKQVWFKPPAKPGWAVYRRGQFPDRAKAIGFMRPDWFHEGPNGQPGFIKTIEGVSKYPNTVSITTDSFGPIDVYLDGDAQIL
jgi:hypothetical protein